MSKDRHWMIFAGYLLWNIVEPMLRCILSEEASQKHHDHIHVAC